MGALGAVAAGVGWRFWPAPALAFDTNGVPDGFRRLVRETGGLTAALTGISLGDGRVLLKGDALCAATFDGAAGGAGSVTIAGFTDYFCPYCRVLDAKVREIAGGDPRVKLIWHQVPLLGRASDMAARGILAAAEQGADEALHTRLIRTSFVPNPAYLRDFAKSEGFDEAQFMEMLTSAATQAQLDTSLAAFRAFGFAGTPGLVIGRTVISGAISKAELRAVVAEEIAAPAPCS